MRKYLCCLLGLFLPLVLTAQEVRPDPKNSLEATLLGDPLIDPSPQNQLTQYYLVKNIHAESALTLDAPIIFPLVGPAGVGGLSLTHEGRALKDLVIPPGRQVLIKATAAAPHLGTYKGSFQLAYHYQQGNITYERFPDVLLTATRTTAGGRKSSPFFKVEPIAILVQAGKCPAKVRFVIRDISGDGGEMQHPLLLLNKNRGDAGLQAQSASYTLAQEVGNTLQPLTGSTLVFAPNEAKRICATFSDLPLAEEYTGSVILQGEKFIDQSQSFTLRLSRTVWCAILVITSGLLLAALARYFYNKVSPRLKQRLKLLGIKADFEGIAERIPDLNDMETSSLKRILGFVDDLLRKVGDPSLSEAILANVQSNFEVRRTLFYRVIDLRQALDAADPPNNGLDALVRRTHIEFLRVYTNTEAQLQEQISEIGKAEGLIREQLLNELKTNIDSLRQVIKDNDEILSSEDYASLNETIEHLMDIRNQDLWKALYEYEFFALQTPRALSKGLMRHLEGKAFPGDAWEAAEWAELNSTVQAQLKAGLDTRNPQLALTAYQKAFATFRGMMDAQLQKKNITNPVTPEYTNAAALKAYENPGEAKRSIPLTHTGTHNKVDTAQPIALGRIGRPMKGHEPPASEVLKSTDCQLFWSETIYALIVLLLSIIIGLQVLYLGNETWGSVKDILVAFTWGFGIHAISRNTDLGKHVFSYVTDHISNIPPPPSPPGP